MESINKETFIWIKAALPLILQLISLGVAIRIDPFIQKEKRHLLFITVLLISTLLIQGIGDYNATTRFQRYFYSILGYSIRPVIIVLFILITADQTENMKKLLWSSCIINALIYVSSFFYPIAIYISEKNKFFRGPLAYTCFYVSFILIIYHTQQALKRFFSEKKKISLIPISATLLIIAATVADLNTENAYISYLTIAIISASLLYYIWLHMQFVSEHEKELLAEQRIRIMISQIQPHFLFNTLSTIQALCKIDPEKAFDTCEKFGVYLRQNIDSLNQSELIPFNKELEHTKVYAEIEMLRFPSIRMEYDIKDSEFDLPALSIQPIVENSIRHGVRIREEGIVKVSTYEENNNHVIIIEDNGTGFDPDKDFKDEGTHIGLKNVKERLEKMCNGTLDIESTIDVGTRITITIPVSEDKS
ncbi:MAG: histidine kinase [Erysipelotrichaceae bacterium]|nr:histidine kinase [Erysipelotrichaceae bacterium]